MIGIIYSTKDEAGTNMAEHIVKTHEFETVDKGPIKYAKDDVRVCAFESSLDEAEQVDLLGFDFAIFLSKHNSEAGVSAFSTHSMGNWTSEAKFGGKGKQLSYAAPVVMLAVLSNMSKIGEPIGKTYEATHHGPLLKTPSLFAEIGGNREALGNKKYAAEASGATYSAATSALNDEVDYRKVAIGIGSNHYPEKFSRLAIEKSYAFSHILPKYAIMNEDGTNNLDVLQQTLERSTHMPEIAVIEWKSLNSAAKEEAIKKLDEIGLDYEKV